MKISVKQKNLSLYRLDARQLGGTHASDNMLKLLH